jgi:hypothetical protein
MMPRKPPDPDELSFSKEHWKQITPYTSTKNAQGESTKFAFSIDTDIAREIDNLFPLGLNHGIPYKNRGDFARDATYKWLILCKEMIQPGSTDSNPILQMEAHVQREAANANARHNLDTGLDLIGANLALYLQEHAADQIAKDLGEWVRRIQAFEKEHPYWFRRWRRKFSEDSWVQKAVQFLEAHTDGNFAFLGTIHAWQEELRRG